MNYKQRKCIHFNYKILQKLSQLPQQLGQMKNSEWENPTIVTQRLSSVKRLHKSTFSTGPTQQDYINLLARVRLLEDEVVCEKIKNQTIERKSYEYIQTIAELEYTNGDLKLLLDRTNNELRRQFEQNSQIEGYEQNIKQIGSQLKQLNQIVEKKNKQCQKLIQINNKLKEENSLIEQRYKQFHDRKQLQRNKIKEILELLHWESQPSFSDQMYNDMQLIQERILDLKENFQKAKSALDKCRKQGSESVIKQKERIIQLEYALKLAQKRNQDLQKRKNMQSSFVIDKKVEDIIDEMLKKEDQLTSRISELQLQNQQLREQIQSQRQQQSKYNELHKNDSQKQLKQAKQTIRKLIMQKDNINQKFQSLSTIRDFQTSRVMTQQLEMSKRYRESCEENKRLKLKISQLESDKKMLQKQLSFRNFK